MSETPQRHGHTGPGDGGKLDNPEVSTITDADDGTEYDVGDDLAGGLTQVASGSVTIASSGTAFEATGLTNEQGFFLPVVTANETLSTDLGFTHDESSSAAIDFHLTWDDSAGEWDLEINNSTGSEHAVQWRIYEL